MRTGIIFFATIAILNTPSVRCTYEIETNDYLDGQIDYDKLVHKLTKSLHHKYGYEAQQGHYHWFSQTDCINLPTCFFNNPTSPYGLLMLPKGLREDPNMRPLDFCQVFCKVYTDGIFSADWRLDVDEVIVILGNTPPIMRYFGFLTYLMYTTHSEDFESQYPANCPSGATRCPVFGSLTDTINPFRINSIDENDVFDKPFALILASSKTTEDIVKQQLIKSRFPEQAINTMPIPAKQLNLSSYDVDSDSLTYLARIASETSQEAQYIFNEYINITKNGEPFLVYRYTLMKDKKNIMNRISNSLYDYQSLIERRIDPYGYQTQNANVSLEHLLQLVLKFYVDEGYDTPEITKLSTGVPSSGRICIETGTECQGDTRDAAYFASSSDGKNMKLSDDINDFFIVVGVNHKETNYAVYSSMTIYDATKAMGIESIRDNVYNECGNIYNSGGVIGEAFMANMYVYKFKRDCENEGCCYEVPSSEENTDDNGVWLPLENDVYFVERAYVNPKTLVGSDIDQVVSAYLLHYTS